MEQSVLSSLSIDMTSEIGCTSSNAATLGRRFFPNAECPMMTCVYPPFLIFSATKGAKFSGKPCKRESQPLLKYPSDFEAQESLTLS
jgi:hypothetical protein